MTSSRLSVPVAVLLGWLSMATGLVTEHQSYYGGHNYGHYDRHDDDGLLGILGD
ncbi:MAG: hypothetical protein LC808_37890 [Actinobacteria bacterium]|nr:hypothetical protein [Actinomycetota bacterium]